MFVYVSRWCSILFTARKLDISYVSRRNFHADPAAFGAPEAHRILAYNVGSFACFLMIFVDVGFRRRPTAPA
jgi:hypothetical protein